MKQKVITIKRHPIVFIKNIFAAELCAFIIYSLIASLADYGPIYNNSIFSKIISYETARFLFLTLIEVFITIYVFARWFFAKYSFGKGTIIFESGIILKKKKAFSVISPISLSYSINPLGKFLKYGDIVVKSRNETITLRDVSYPEMRANIILQKQTPPQTEEKLSIHQLLAKTENQQLEFKSSLRWDTRLNQLNKDLEKAAMKTVAAFLNSAGGHLIIGVDDKKNPLGIHLDYNSLPKKDTDGFENHFTQLFNTMIGPEFRHHIQLTFNYLENKDICIIKVTPSFKPAYLKNNNEESFFIRTGNTTTPLKLSEAENYIKNRWQ